MKKVITGDHSVAYGAKLSRAEVVAAYPITPQTLIVEHISEFISDGEMYAKFMPMESEHSVMSATIAAQAAGARTFTATASQGLAFMHEMLYVAAPLRLPIVMVNVNRTIAYPVGIWCEYNDSMAERDSGWLQVYIENNQEALDMVIQGYMIAEDKRVLLPIMPCMDGFVLSHTVEPVELPAQEDVDVFLPGYEPVYSLDPDNPAVVGSFMPPEYIMEMRRQTMDAVEASKKVIPEVGKKFASQFGRDYGGLVEEIGTEDADVVLMTMGTVTSTAREVVAEYRGRVGLVKLRFFRPFPSEEVRDLASRFRAIGVFDRSLSYSGGGPVFEEVKAALYGYSDIPVINHLAGLGGRDVTAQEIRKMCELTLQAADGESVSRVNWHATRGVPV